MHHAAELHRTKKNLAALGECRETALKRRRRRERRRGGELSSKEAVEMDKCDDKVSEWHRARELVNDKLAKLYKNAASCETRSCTSNALRNLKAEHAALRRLNRPKCADKLVEQKKIDKKEERKEEAEAAKDLKKKAKKEKKEAKGEKIVRDTAKRVPTNIKFVPKSREKDTPPLGEVFLFQKKDKAGSKK